MFLKKNPLVLAGIFMLFIWVSSAAAEDITGAWIVPGALRTVRMVFKVDGAKLTGTVRTHTEDETEIKDGKIKGNKISFYIERLVHQKAIKIRFKGTLVGEEIRFTRDEGGALLDLVAKRDTADSSAPKPDSRNRI